MSAAFTSPLGVGEPKRPSSVHWSLALAGAAALQMAGAWAVLTFTPEPEAVVLETQEAFAVKLGPPGGRIQDRKPEPPKPKPKAAAPVAPPPDMPLERAADSEDVQLSAALPEAGDGPVSSGFGAGGQGGKPEPQAEPEPEPPFDRALLNAYLSRARLAYLERLDYPKSLLDRGVQGAGAVHITVDRKGRVLATRITQSTGNAELDGLIQAAADDLRRLEPLPKGYPKDRMTFSVPVRFMVVEGR